MDSGGWVPGKFLAVNLPHDKFMMMMIIAPNSLVRQKERAQGEEEEAGDRRNGGHTGTLMPGADAPTIPTLSGVSDSRNSRKHGQWCELLLYRRGREG